MDPAVLAVLGSIVLLAARAVFPIFVRYLIAGWAWMTVQGLPSEVRARRIGEIVSDAHEHQASLVAEGHGLPEAAILQLLRFLRGIPDDLLWRCSLEFEVLKGFRFGAIFPLEVLVGSAAVWFAPDFATTIFVICVHTVLWSHIWRRSEPIGDLVQASHGKAYAVAVLALAIGVAYFIPWLILLIALPSFEIQGVSSFDLLTAVGGTNLASAGTTVVGIALYNAVTRGGFSSWICFSLIAMWFSASMFGHEGEGLVQTTFLVGWAVLFFWRAELILKRTGLIQPV